MESTKELLELKSKLGPGYTISIQKLFSFSTNTQLENNAIYNSIKYMKCLGINIKWIQTIHCIIQNIADKILLYLYKYQGTAC